jgi:hypothetical protein
LVNIKKENYFYNAVVHFNLSSLRIQISFLFFGVFILSNVQSIFSQICPILPTPLTYKELNEAILIEKTLVIDSTELPNNLKNQLKELASTYHKLEIKYSLTNSKLKFKKLINVIDNSYTINVSNEILISYSSEASCFYALHSLMQLIQEDSGAGFANITTGIIHAGDDGTISTGSSAQGKTSGTVYWQVPTTSTSDWRYRCSVHSSMVGTLDIKSLPDLVEIYDSATPNLYFNENVVFAISPITYTLALGDISRVVGISNPSSTIVSVPTNASVAFPMGTVINVYRAQTGTVTIAGASGVTVRNAGSITSQYGEVSLRKRDHDEWVLSGDVS